MVQDHEIIRGYRSAAVVVDAGPTKRAGALMPQRIAIPYHVVTDRQVWTSTPPVHAAND